MARAGYVTTAADFSAEALRLTVERAAAAGVEVAPLRLDLEADPPPVFGEGKYDLVAVFNFLHRPLFESIRLAVKPGGLAIYKTYLVTGTPDAPGPRDPRFRLQPNELREQFKGWRVLRYQEETDGRATAALFARKPL